MLKIKKNNLESLMMFIICLAYLEPTFISHMNSMGWKFIHYFFIMLRILVIFYGISLLVKERKHDFIEFFLFCFFLFITINEFIFDNSGKTKTLLWVFSEVALICIIRVFSNDQRIQKFIDILFYGFAIIVVLDFVLLLLCPNGIFRSELYTSANTGAEGHFLGFKNIHIFYFIPCSIISFYKKNENSKLLFWFLHITMFITLILMRASTSIIAYSLMLLVYVFPGVFCKIKSTVVFLVSMVISYLLIASSKLMGAVDIVSVLFSKSSSFSGRTKIWMRGIQAHVLRPWFGYGMGSKPINIYYQQYHNKYLDTLVWGGIVGFIMFIVCVVLITIRFDKVYGKRRSITVACILGYSIIFLMEGNRGDLFFWPIITLLYLNGERIFLDKNN